MLEAKLIGNSDSGNSSPGEEVIAKAIVAHEDVDPPSRGFVMANTLSGLRRLRQIGYCAKVLGLHYHRSTAFGQVVLYPMFDYDKRCFTCFESETLVLSPKQQFSSDSDSSSSDGNSVVAKLARESV